MGGRNGSEYSAKVFRGKMLAAMDAIGLTPPEHYPEKWVVDCKHVGDGEKAISYLGRYLYRGVVAERDLVSVKGGEVTFRYLDSKSGKRKIKSVSGTRFIWLLLQHVLPHRFRRARSYGFLHPNSKLITPLLQYLFRISSSHPPPQPVSRPLLTCRECGGIMAIVQTSIMPKGVQQLESG